MRLITSISFLIFCFCANGQSISGIYKIQDLEKRIHGKDTIYVVNFWARWCKPCIQELPIFDSVAVKAGSSPVKVLLVSLDFAEDREKVNRFLKEKKITTECVLLDEINGDVFVNRISKNWSGAIPATLIKKEERKILLKKKLKSVELQKAIDDFTKKR
jgi:thiol-disulfide isomerase/thioredoxin